jgi:hypothetical protein
MVFPALFAQLMFKIPRSAQQKQNNHSPTGCGLCMILLHFSAVRHIRHDKFACSMA